MLKFKIISGLLIGVIGLCAPGCHKKDASSVSGGQPATNSARGDAANGSEAVSTPPSPAVTARAQNAVQQSVAGDVDASLTAQLRVFVQKQGRLPANFGEFANARLDSVPRPPAGKKWVIDGPNLQVKAVASQ